MEKTNHHLLQGIDTLIMRVSNMAISKSWYQDKLGLEVVWEDAEMKLAVLDTKGPTSLTLWQTAEKITVHKETASYPIFKTGDAKALKEALEQKGIATGDLVQDDYVVYFFFQDPDGNVLEACQVLG